LCLTEDVGNQRVAVYQVAKCLANLEVVEWSRRGVEEEVVSAEVHRIGVLLLLQLWIASDNLGFGGTDEFTTEAVNFTVAVTDEVGLWLGCNADQLLNQWLVGALVVRVGFPYNLFTLGPLDQAVWTT